MTLTFLANLLGAGLIAFGGSCFLLKETHGKTFQEWLRNERLGLWVFTIAHLWFFVNLWRVDEKDCESFKSLLFLFFLFAFLGCAFYWKDFIIVRGIAVLTALTVHRALWVGYMEAHILRPYVSGLFYFWIVLAVLFGLNPYLARDFVHALFQKNRLWLRSIAVASIFYGFHLIGLAL